MGALVSSQITIILPVYGRSKLLAEAWASVQAQSDQDWFLIIADDGSDSATTDFIKSGPALDYRTTWVRRPSNLGLFSNLNLAIDEYLQSWCLLLCSDDRLLPDAISNLRTLHKKWPSVELIISTHLSIDSQGASIPSLSTIYHNKVSMNTVVFEPNIFVPLLLRWGSLNGNLSGMAFSLNLWRASGSFRTDWSHAADWEWLIRASERAPVLFNRQFLVEVRTHVDQLSNANRKSGNELLEVSLVVKLLLNHAFLSTERKRFSWAAHRLQFQLWNLLKIALNGDYRIVASQLALIHSTVNLFHVLLALLAWLPKRLKYFFGFPNA